MQYILAPSSPIFSSSSPSSSFSLPLPKLRTRCTEYDSFFASPYTNMPFQRTFSYLTTCNFKRIQTCFFLFSLTHASVLSKKNQIYICVFCSRASLESSAFIYVPKTKLLWHRLQLSLFSILHSLQLTLSSLDFFDSLLIASRFLFSCINYFDIYFHSLGEQHWVLP